MNTNFSLSKYNQFTKIDNETICFNPIRNTMIVLKNKEYDNLFGKIAKDKEFQKKYPTIFKKMNKWGFIISTNIDETALLLMRNREKIFADKTMRLTINPTLDCNFNCWYCSVESANTVYKKERMSDDTVERIEKFINKLSISNEYTGLHLDWFGGEPLMYFNEIVYKISLKAKEIMKLKGINFINQITTNAYLITNEMIDRFVEINLNRFQITIDGNEIRHNKIRNENNKPSYRKIIGNIKKICNKIDDAKIILRLNYDKKTLIGISTLFEEFNDIEKSKIQIDFQRVWQVKSDDSLIQLLKSTIKQAQAKGFYVGYYAYKPLYNHTCYSDRFNYAAINYDGNVFKCTARDYSAKHIVAELNSSGQLVWDKEIISKRLSKATFENKNCIDCKYLGLCFGPCSQKMLEYNENNHPFSSICTIKNSELNIDDFLIMEARNRNLLINK